MKKLLILIGFLLVALLGYSQDGVKISLTKPNLLHKETAILFSDSCSDEFDICCDAIFLGQPIIWTSIGNDKYVINTFGEIIGEKLIPLGLSIELDTGLFIIDIEETYGVTIPVRLMDNQTQELFTFPHNTTGPISNNRFSLLFEEPLNVEVVNGCDFGLVVINNNIPNVSYTLIHDGEVTYYLPTTDTIFGLYSGDYTLILDDYFTEEVNFSISNTVIDAQLIVPTTELYTYDSFISPLLNIYSPYTTIYWAFGDGNTASNQTSPIHQYMNAGEYNLMVIITEGFCNKIFESLITVQSINGVQELQKPSYNNINSYYAIDGRLMNKNNKILDN